MQFNTQGTSACYDGPLGGHSSFLKSFHRLNTGFLLGRHEIRFEVAC